MSYLEWLKQHPGYRGFGWANGWDKDREAEVQKAIGDSDIRYVRLWSETLAVCDEKKLYYHMTSGG